MALNLSRNVALVCLLTVWVIMPALCDEEIVNVVQQFDTVANLQGTSEFGQPRVWHTATEATIPLLFFGKLTDFPVIVVYGGIGSSAQGTQGPPLSTMLSDMWLYEPPTAHISPFPFWWRYPQEQLVPEAPYPGARAGHTANVLATGLFSILGGTFFDPFPGQETYYSMDLWTFNLSRINSLNSRNGFFLALNGEEDKLIDDFKELKLWQQHVINGPNPPPRKWHTTSTMSVGGVDVLVVFGGANGTRCVQDCMRSDNFAWILQHPGGQNAQWLKGPIGPGARYFHSATTFQNSVFVTGGVSLEQAANFLNDDLWVLSGVSLGSLKWQNLASITPVASAASVLVDGNLFLYGGLAQQQRHTHSLNFYLTTKRVISVNLTAALDGHATFNEDDDEVVICNQGTGILGAAALVRQLSPEAPPYVYLTGGAQSIHGQLNPTSIVSWVNKPKTAEWSSIENTPEPLPSINAAAAMLNNDTIFLFGGRSTLQPGGQDTWRLSVTYSDSDGDDAPTLEGFSWQRVVILPQEPSRREGHTFDALVDPTLQPIEIGAVFGGHLASRSLPACFQPPCNCLIGDQLFQVHFYSDMWVFDAREFLWFPVTVTSPQRPACRTHHVADAIDEGGKSVVYVHGGLSASADHGEYFESNLKEPRWASGNSNTTGVYVLGDLWRGVLSGLDTGNQTVAWTQIQTLNHPSARAYHAATVLPDYMVITGGLARDKFQQLRVVGDTWILSFDTLIWRQLIQEVNPGLRFGHSMRRMGRITALMYGGYGSANLTYYPRASYLISLPPGNHHWTEWSKNEDQPGSALSAGASFLGTYSRFYNIWGEPEGSYVFFTKGASQYLVTCQEGLGFEAACVREQHRNNGFAIDCGCTTCPAGTFAEVEFIQCQPCPGQSFTPSEGASSVNDCRVCNPNACSGRGECTLVDAAIGSVSCSCHLGFSGERCSNNWGVPVLALGILIVLFVGIVLAYRYYGQTKSYRVLKFTTELQENLLEETKLENEKLKNAWEINHKSLKLKQRIDLKSQGGTAEVWLARWQTYQVAVKYLKKSLLTMDDSLSQVFKEEVDFMRTIRHDNIVLFLGAGISPENVPFLVTEYMHRGSLFELLAEAPGELTWNMRAYFALDCASGLDYLHSLTPKRLHRDLKSGNVLIAEDYTAKLADFGTSRLVDGLSNEAPVAKQFDDSDSVTTAYLTKAIGTTCWMAPEVMQGDAYGLSADIYSFSIVLWEILTMKRPFESYVNEWSVQSDVIEGTRPDITPDERNGRAEYVSLIELCWQQEPDNRPSAADVLLDLETYLAHVPDPRRGRRYTGSMSRKGSRRQHALPSTLA